MRCASGRGLVAGMAVTLVVVPGSFLSSAGRSLSASRRFQFDAGAPGLGETDGDGLLGRRCAVFPFPYVVNLFAHEFSGLRTGRFPLTGILSASLDGAFFRHSRSPSTSLARATGREDRTLYVCSGVLC